MNQEEFLRRLQELLAGFGYAVGEDADKLLIEAAEAAERQLAAQLEDTVREAFTAAKLDLAAALYLRGETYQADSSAAGDVKAVTMGDVSLTFSEDGTAARRRLELADELYRSAMVQIAGERGVQW